MLADSQMPNKYRQVIDEQLNLFKVAPSITHRNQLPVTDDIPLDNQSHWFKIPSVICVYVDMQGSTKFSADANEQNVASAYQLYTGTAVRLLHAFEPPYIDVRGDGAFALFNGNDCHRALAAAVTFKTFATKVFVPEIKARTGFDVGSHIGIDQNTVLVRRMGLRRMSGRTDRQNEVWAGKPVNMAAKLASMTEDSQLLVSDRFFQGLKDERALMSCGCPTGDKRELWEEVNLEGDPRFDFSIAHSLWSCWCTVHGEEYCNALVGLR